MAKLAQSAADHMDDMDRRTPWVSLSYVISKILIVAFITVVVQKGLYNEKFYI